MIKYLFYIFLASISFSQIQQDGYPKYFDSSQDINIQYITVNQEEQINRDFHPMVFKFGEEYNDGMCTNCVVNAHRFNNLKCDFLQCIKSFNNFGRRMSLVSGGGQRWHYRFLGFTYKLFKTCANIEIQR